MTSGLAPQASASPREHLGSSYTRNCFPHLKEEGSMLGEASECLPYPYLSIVCRKLRIGTYNAKPLGVVLSTEGLKIDLPNRLPAGPKVTVNIPMSDITEVMVSFSRFMPVVFISISASGGPKIRKTLHMTNSKNTSFYFDPSSSDETVKRITLLPERLRFQSGDFKKTFQKIAEDCRMNFIEIENKTANEILIKSSPCETDVTPTPRLHIRHKVEVPTLSSGDKYKHKKLRKGDQPLGCELRTDNADIKKNDSFCGQQSLCLEKELDGVSDLSLSMLCRTIRIGTFKAKPCDRVLLSAEGIDMTIPLPTGLSATVNIPMSDISELMVSFSRYMPVLFLRISANGGRKIRKALQMSDPENDSFYFDPCSSDETLKRITLLPEKLRENFRAFLLKIAEVSQTSLVEITNFTANEMLIKSSPCEGTLRSRSRRLEIVQMVSPPSDNKDEHEPNSCSESFLMAAGFQPSYPAAIDEPDSYDGHHSSGFKDDGKMTEEAMDLSSAYPCLAILCESVLIGSYKAKPFERVIFSTEGLEMKIPLPSGLCVIVSIPMSYISQVMASFSPSMPVLFISLANGQKVRNVFHMNDPNNLFYFDPCSNDETLKRIKLLPGEVITEDFKTTLQRIVEISNINLVEISHGTAMRVL